MSHKWIWDFFLKIAKGIVEGRALDVAYIDLSMAFDKVLYCQLVQKVEYMVPSVS